MHLWEILIDGSAIISHMVSTTPYVTASKISLDFRFHEELVKLEDRLISLLVSNGEDAGKAVKNAAEICDDLRKKQMKYSEKPAHIFVLWYSILIVSYKNFKDGIGAK